MNTTLMEQVAMGVRVCIGVLLFFAYHLMEEGGRIFLCTVVLLVIFFSCEVIIEVRSARNEYVEIFERANLAATTQSLFGGAEERVEMKRSLRVIAEQTTHLVGGLYAFAKCTQEDLRTLIGFGQAIDLKDPRTVTRLQEQSHRLQLQYGSNPAPVLPALCDTSAESVPDTESDTSADTPVSAPPQSPVHAPLQPSPLDVDGVPSVAAATADSVPETPLPHRSISPLL
jgi:hypothetical protein